MWLKVQQKFTKWVQLAKQNFQRLMALTEIHTLSNLTGVISS